MQTVGSDGLCNRAIEFVAGRTVHRELPHLAQLDLGVFVAAALAAGFVGSRELMQRAGVTLDTLQTFQRLVRRLEVHAVTGRTRDLFPSLRIALDMTCFAALVGHFRVRLQLFRIFDDLCERHLAACQQCGLMARFAAEVAVLAARKTLVRIDHQMAAQTKFVVVLHVLVHAVAVKGGRSQSDEESDRQCGQDGARQTTQPLPNPFKQRPTRLLVR